MIIYIYRGIIHILKKIDFVLSRLPKFSFCRVLYSINVLGNIYNSNKTTFNNIILLFYDINKCTNIRNSSQMTFEYLKKKQSDQL